MPVELPIRPAATEMRQWTGHTILAWLGGFFGLIFAANGVFVWLALDSWSGVEVDSSYAAGRKFSGELRAASAQSALRWSLSGRATRADDGSATIAVDARDFQGAPLTGLTVTTVLARPTDRGLDRAATMRETGAGQYRAVIDDVLAGQWILLLEARSGDGRRFKSRNRVFFRQ